MIEKDQNTLIEESNILIKAVRRPGCVTYLHMYLRIYIQLSEWLVIWTLFKMKKYIRVRITKGLLYKESEQID